MGNPVYNWDALRATGYRWSIDRADAQGGGGGGGGGGEGGAARSVDAIRRITFPRFAAAKACSTGGHTTAQSGQWVRVGRELFEQSAKELGGLPFIAEDLGPHHADSMRSATIRNCRPRGSVILP